jgi:hypothetical protein
VVKLIVCTFPYLSCCGIAGCGAMATYGVIRFDRRVFLGDSTPLGILSYMHFTRCAS